MHLALLLAAVTFGAAVVAPGVQAADETQAHFGSMSYRLFCVGCHGVDGRGNAGVLGALGLRQVDLTTIEQRNGGVFDPEAVAGAITGAGGAGHARVKMAPWAEVFANEFSDFAEHPVVDLLVDRRIDHLVVYIESLQAE